MQTPSSELYFAVNPALRTAQDLGLAAQKDVPALCRITDLVQMSCDVDAAWITADGFVPAASGFAEVIRTEAFRRLEARVIALADNTETPVAVPDVQRLETSESLPACPLRAIVAVPVQDAYSHTVVWLWMAQQEPQVWSRKVTGAARHFAELVSTEIRVRAADQDAAALRDELMKEAEMRSRLDVMRGTMSEVFSAPGLSLTDRFEQLMQVTLHTLGMETGRIYLRDDTGQVSIFCEISSGVTSSADAQTLRSQLTARIMSERRPIILGDVSASPFMGQLDQQGDAPGRFMGAPLMFDGQVIGTLEFSGRAPAQEPIIKSAGPLLRALCVFSAGPLALYAQDAPQTNDDLEMLAARADAVLGRRQSEA